MNENPHGLVGLSSDAQAKREEGRRAFIRAVKIRQEILDDRNKHAREGERRESAARERALAAERARRRVRRTVVAVLFLLLVAGGAVALIASGAVG